MPIKFVSHADLGKLEKQVNDALKADPQLRFHSLTKAGNFVAVLVTTPEIAAITEDSKPAPKPKTKGKRDKN